MFSFLKFLKYRPIWLLSLTEVTEPLLFNFVVLFTVVVAFFWAGVSCSCAIFFHLYCRYNIMAMKTTSD